MSLAMLCGRGIEFWKTFGGPIYLCLLSSVGIYRVGKKSQPRHSLAKSSDRFKQPQMGLGSSKGLEGTYCIPNTGNFPVSVSHFPFNFVFIGATLLDMVSFSKGKEKRDEVKSVKSGSGSASGLF